MYDSFRGKQHRLVVAVAFEPSPDTLLSSAESFVKRTDMTPRLVHVVEPWSGRDAVTAFPGEFLSTRIWELVERKMKDEAKSKLSDLAGQVGSIGPVETQVLSGRPADALRADAMAGSGTLIMCGLSDGSYRFMPRGMSTALSLMADSTTPVMILPSTAVDFSKERLRVLIADDLSESSRTALGTAIELALCLGGVELIHAHVCRQSRTEFDFWAKLVERELAHQKNSPPKGSLFERTSQALLTQLEHRVGTARTLLETSGSSYRDVLRFGDVQDELSSLVEETSPDILVFGRHETLHRRPFAIGKLPFHAMLNFKRPVLVAPSHHH